MIESKLIIDTDMGGDCDDAGALALAHNIADEANVHILGCVHCGSEISGAVAIKAINDYYNRPEIPVGLNTSDTFLEGDAYTRYTKQIMDDYLKERSMPEFSSSVALLRKLLSENTDVTIAVIGMQNNIEELLKSKGDDISPLTGLELVKKSVRNMYIMGGNFTNADYEEYNIKMHIESARYVANHFPAPIIYCGFELGSKIKTGKNLANCPDNNPVKKSYKIYLEGDICRESWDLITVYCALFQDNIFYKKNEDITVDFSESGKTIVLNGGKDCYLSQTVNDDRIIEEINRFLF